VQTIIRVWNSCSPLAYDYSAVFADFFVVGEELGILNNSIKVVYTFLYRPYGTCCIGKHLSIDIVSLTGQSVNRPMKDAKNYILFLIAPPNNL